MSIHQDTIPHDCGRTVQSQELKRTYRNPKNNSRIFSDLCDEAEEMRRDCWGRCKASIRGRKLTKSRMNRTGLDEKV